MRTRPISLKLFHFPSDSEIAEKHIDWNKQLKNEVVFISSSDPAIPDVDLESTHGYLLELLENVWTSLQQIYVDVESCYTVSGIVGEIVEQVRQFDKATSPLVWHDSQLEHENLNPITNLSLNQKRMVNASVRRVVQILNRSRICLVLDGLDGFIYRPTNHHGVVSFAHKEAVLFYHFVDTLLSTFERESNGNGSKIIASSDRLVGRRLPASATLGHSSSFRNAEASFNRYLKKQVSSIKAAVFTKKIRADTATHNGRMSLIQSLESSPKVALQEHALACVFIVSARRTRSETLVREILCTINGRNAEQADVIEELLNNLIAEKYLTVLEGGYYSMDRTLRNQMYRAATNRTGSRNIAAKLSQSNKDLSGVEDVVCQLVLLICVHSVLGMIYYDKIFANSRDCKALLESHYHNMSAYRFATDLDLIVRKFGDKAIELINQTLCKLEETCDRDADTPICSVLFYTSSQEFKRESCGIVRRRLLTRFARNWQRHEGRLQMSTTPELVISFCRSTLDQDLTKHGTLQARRDHLLKQLGKDSESIILKISVDDEEFVLDCVSDMRRQVQDTLNKSLSNTGDFENVAKTAFDQLVHVVGKKAAKLGWQAFLATRSERSIKGLLKNDSSVDVRTWADFLSASCSSGRSTDGVTRETERNAIQTIAKSIRQGIEKEIFQFRTHGQLESYVRLLGVEVEIAIDLGDRITLDQCVKECQKAIQILHDCPSVKRPLAQEVSVSIPEASGLLIPYRSLLRIMIGRLYRELNRNRFKLEPRPVFVNWLSSKSVDKSNEQPPCRTTSQYSHVFREFQFARSGLAEHNPTLKALCDLYSAESALDCAEAVIWSSLDPDRVNIASSKLRSAKGYLQVAKSWLLRGSTNVEAWRLYSQLKLRHASQSLLERCGKLVDQVDSETMSRDVFREYGKIDELVRSALKATRDGLDHSPPTAEREIHELYVGWLNLMMACFCFAVLMGARFPGERQLKGVIDVFKQYWTYANHCENLPIKTEIPRWVNIVDQLVQEKKGLKLSGMSQGVDVCQTAISQMNADDVNRWWDAMNVEWNKI